jgi:undecaprenyl-diphosphatase
VRPARKTLIAFAAIAVLLGTFAVLASEVIEVETDTVDQAILLALRSTDGTPIGPVWLERAMVHLSSLGSVAVATLVVIATSAFLFLDRKPRQALLVIGGTVVVAIALEILKSYVGRLRPSMVIPIDSVDGMSFPSGHTMIASVLYPTLAFVAASNLKQRRLRVFLIAFAIGLAVLVGFTRVYIGVHYPTDVLGGWCLGAALAIACSLIVDTFQRHGFVEPPVPTEA